MATGNAQQCSSKAQHVSASQCSTRNGTRCKKRPKAEKGYGLRDRAPLPLGGGWLVTEFFKALRDYDFLRAAVLSVTAVLLICCCNL
jgi:hypothetical protein